MSGSRTSLVTSTDIALLRALSQERSLVGASRRVGISRDRAVYRVERLERAFGGPVLRAMRGGSAHGGSTLTALGDRIVRGGFDSVELLGAHPVTPLPEPNLIHGVYHRAPTPEVRVPGGPTLRVAFPARDGEEVRVLLDPESVVVARHRFASSARNVLKATIERVRHEAGALGRTLDVRCGDTRLRVTVTEEPVRQLGLRRGAIVWLYVKATSLRRIEDAPEPTARTRPR